MTTSTTDAREAFATTIRITDDALEVELRDGRSVSVPLAWYPRLAHGSEKERRNWRLIGRGEGIHWPALDEDISVASLLHGYSSAENQASLKRWLESRRAAV